MIHDGLDIFGFTKVPFLNHTEKTFSTTEINHTFTLLERHVRRGGFAVLSGPVGCGKTTTIKYLANSLNPNQVRVVSTTFSCCNPSNMIQLLCHETGIEIAQSFAINLKKLQTAFSENSHQSVLLVIDEIQKIDNDTIEIIRLLSDASTNLTHTLAVILAGHHDFLKLLRKQIYEPLRQRIALYLRVAPLSKGHTTEYLNHCLQDAGANQKIFDMNACSLIHDSTKGIMRRINFLALAALHIAADAGEARVDIEHIHTAIDNVFPPELED